MTPLAIDLFCGLGGWTDGLLAEGYRVIGFDNERHEYDGEKYPAQLVIQDVLTLHGSQFQDAALIVASPPCQEYSYMAMPWTRAKAKAAAIEADATGAERARLNALFDACFRIQREACEAAGRHVPLVVENVRGAQRWVGRARWNYGSFYLWGDVPALMPILKRAKLKGGDVGWRERSGVQLQDHFGTKVPTMGAGWYPPGHPKHVPGLAFNTHADRVTKNPGFRFDGSWRSFQSESVRRTNKGNGVRFTSRDCGIEGTKQPGISGPRDNGKGDAWFQNGAARYGSRSNSRKAASARIAKIPLLLARHVAQSWWPSCWSRTVAR